MARTSTIANNVTGRSRQKRCNPSRSCLLILSYVSNDSSLTMRSKPRSRSTIFASSILSLTWRHFRASRFERILTQVRYCSRKATPTNISFISWEVWSFTQGQPTVDTTTPLSRRRTVSGSSLTMKRCIHSIFPSYQTRHSVPSNLPNNSKFAMPTC